MENDQNQSRKPKAQEPRIPNAKGNPPTCPLPQILFKKNELAESNPKQSSLELLTNRTFTVTFPEGDKKSCDAPWTQHILELCPHAKKILVQMCCQNSFCHLQHSVQICKILSTAKPY